MIATVTLNPVLDRTVWLRTLEGGETLRVDETSGGKGVNCARVLSALNVKAVALVAYGGKQGARSEELARAEGVNVLPFETEGETRLMETFAQPDYRHQTTFQQGTPLKASERRRMRDAIHSLLPGLKLLTVNGSAIGEDAAFCAEIIAMAHDKKVPVWLDSHGSAFAEGLKARPCLCKPNKEELEEALLLRLPDWDGVSELPKVLPDSMKRLNSDEVVLSLGKGGALWTYPGGLCSRRPPWIAEINPVGSGDSFLAGLIYGHLAGMDRMESLRLACALGAANAAMWKAAHVGLKQAEALFGHLEPIKEEDHV